MARFAGGRQRMSIPRLSGLGRPRAASNMATKEVNPFPPLASSIAGQDQEAIKGARTDLLRRVLSLLRPRFPGADVSATARSNV